MVKNSDYGSVDSVPLGKRKKVDDEFSNSPLKKQRTRVRSVPTWIYFFTFSPFLSPLIVSPVENAIAGNKR